MSNSGLHVADVIDTMRRHRRLIVITTILAAVIGAVFYFVGPKKYEGKTEFVVRNPLYSDRNYIYSYDTKFFDYFATEDDIDRVILMAQAEVVQGRVIRDLDLGSAYHLDASDRKAQHELSHKFSKAFNISRTEYKDLVLTYLDTDPDRAAKVANTCVSVLDSVFTEYYKDMRRDMYLSISDKIRDEDSTINALTDTLSALRQQYGIYDIISPSRNNIMLSSLKDNGHKDFGHAVEVIQNIESLKDQVVADRARQTTLVNQYKTGMRMDQLPMIKVVTYARTPVSPKGLSGMYTMLAAAFLGFFFSTILMAISDRYFSTERAND